MATTGALRDAFGTRAGFVLLYVGMTLVLGIDFVMNGVRITRLSESPTVPAAPSIPASRAAISW